MVLTSIAALALAIWLYLICARGGFWLCRERDDVLPAVPPRWPRVTAVVPARNEAEGIVESIGSLARQDYPGPFSIVLVDDDSEDNTAELARRLAAGIGADRGFALISSRGLASGWTGKLWAVRQGVEAANNAVEPPDYLLLTDADIVHTPDSVRALVTRAESGKYVLTSLMARLRCQSGWERSHVPAFVYFFQMLYPFARVNNPRSSVAAAAGGTVLIRREALDRIGGIAAIKDALIDDVTLAAAVKKVGPIYLGHSGLAASVRPYPHFVDIWRMVSRTAFTQLRYSFMLLLLTLVGLTVVWLVPAEQILFGRGVGFACGLAAFLLAAGSYIPTLRRYGRNSLWSLTLPLIALFYMAATVGSALKHWFGAGANWKSRAYGTEQ